MRLGWFEASGIVWSTFRGSPLGTRVHILGRFLTCPFDRIVPEIGPGTLLDLGAGHGLLSRLAAAKGIEVVALDPDLRKILGPFRHPMVKFVAGTAAAVRGRFATVAMVDVFYRIPIPERDSLLASIRAKVENGGVLLIKDLDPEQRLKAWWNRCQEWISDHVFGLTIGSVHAYENREVMTKRLMEAGFDRVEVKEIGRGYWHAHLLYRAEVLPAGGVP